MTTDITKYVPTMPVRSPDIAMSYMQSRISEVSLPEGASVSVALVYDSAIAYLAEPSHRNVLSCTGDSIFRSVKEAAGIGFSFHPALGLAYLVPYRDECKLVVGYRGLLDLVQRATETKFLDSELVYEGDTIDIQLGSEQNVIHKPSLFGQRTPDKILGAYFVCTLPSGMKKVEWMSREEIDAIRRRSKSANQGPWVTDYGQMARKTVIRRAVNQLPKAVNKASLLLSKAIAAEDYATGLADSPQAITAEEKTQKIMAKVVSEPVAEPVQESIQEPIAAEVVDVPSEKLPDGKRQPTNEEKKQLVRDVSEYINDCNAGSPLLARELIMSALSQPPYGTDKIETLDDLNSLRNNILCGMYDIETGKVIA